MTVLSRRRSRRLILIRLPRTRQRYCSRVVTANQNEENTCPRMTRIPQSGTVPIWTVGRRTPKSTPRHSLPISSISFFYPRQQQRSELITVRRRLSQTHERLL